MNDIKQFTGEYRWLSNFYPCTVVLDGEKYPSVEHAYQAAKTLDLKDRERIRNDMVAHVAKKFGREVKLRDGWEEKKIEIMTDLVYQKFSRHKTLREKLLATGNSHIEEGNYWYDFFWGVCNGKGRNELGKILMTVRDKLKGDTDEETISGRKS